MNLIDMKYPEGWEKIFSGDVMKEELYELHESLDYSKIVPNITKVFKPFRYCKPEQVRVVIITEHPGNEMLDANRSKATGLGISLRKSDFNVTNSITNIHKELSRQYSDFDEPCNGNLTNWAKQGVLMLNYNMTMYRDNNKKTNMWLPIINLIIKELNNINKIMYLLWCQNNINNMLTSIITGSKGTIFTACPPHFRSFIGNGCFDACNRTIASIREKERKKGIEGDDTLIEWTDI